MSKYYQGFFKPKNPEKYKGNPTQICYRSSYELRLMNYLDAHPEVLWWQSEELAIPYRSPVDRAIHRYFIDIIFKPKNGPTTMIEVKPRHEIDPPVLAEGKKISRSYKRKVVTYAINQAKWKAAQAYAEDRGWKFKIMDEYDLGIKTRKS